MSYRLVIIVVRIIIDEKEDSGFNCQVYREKSGRYDLAG